jgi:hypothetical protein
MRTRRLLYGGFAIFGAVFFVLALVLPIFSFLSRISVWSISPLISSAAIALVAFAASFPLWCRKRRAWLLPLIVSLLILVLDIPLSMYGFGSFMNPNSSNWILYTVDSAPLYLIPICTLTLSFVMILAGAMVARAMYNPRGIHHAM